MAFAIHRITKKVATRVNEPDVDPATWFIIKRSDTQAVTDFLTLHGSVEPVYWDLIDGPPKRVLVKDQAGKDAVDLARLPSLRSKRLRQVTQKDELLVAKGFEYPASSGKMFALDVQTIVFIVGMYAVRNDQDAPLPIEFNTIDDEGSVILSNANDVKKFHAAAMLAVVTAKSGGTSIKSQLRAAATKAALDAVTDTR